MSLAVYLLPLEDPPKVIPSELPPVPACEHCEVYGAFRSPRNSCPTPDWCPHCDGTGYIGLEFDETVRVQPGSEHAIAVFGARYRDGLEIWTGKSLENAQ